VGFRGLRYRGEVEVNVMGGWPKGHGAPLGIMTTLDPEEGFALYRKRMKREEAFRDLKHLLGLKKVMSKKTGKDGETGGLLLLVYGMLLFCWGRKYARSLITAQAPIRG